MTASAATPSTTGVTGTRAHGATNGGGAFESSPNALELINADVRIQTQVNQF